LRQYEGVGLFIERASAARSAFQLSAANSRAVANIRACLDGIPLALELAAARARAILIRRM
jgi:predicted ATPase